MRAPHDDCEIPILETKGIQIKNHSYRIVLTGTRIIFDFAPENIYRSVPLSFIQGVEPGMHYSGDPVLSLTVLSAHGEVKKVILRFAQRDFPDPEQSRSRWHAELTKSIQKHDHASPVLTPIPASIDLVFCTKCGKKLEESSVFCDRCGEKLPVPVQPEPPGQYGDRVQERDTIPELSSKKSELPQQGQSVPDSRVPAAGKIIPVTASQPKDLWKKKPVTSGLWKKRPVLLIATGLAAVIIAAIVFFTVFPAVIPPHDENTETNADNHGSAVNPEKPYIPKGNPPVQPASMVAPGNPGAVLSSYPSLFNIGDGAGLRDLVSETMKSHYSVDTLNSELAAARSKDYSIQAIQIRNQAIDEGTAALETDFLWNIGGTPVTTSPRIYFVFEHERWRLANLILKPEDI